MIAIPEEFSGACSDTWIAIDNDPQTIESPENLSAILTQLPEIAHRITLSFQHYFDYTNNQIRKFNEGIECLKEFRVREFTSSMKMEPIPDMTTGDIADDYIQNFENCFGMTALSFSESLMAGFGIGASDVLACLDRIESREIVLTNEQSSIFRRMHLAEEALKHISPKL